MCYSKYFANLFIIAFFPETNKLVLAALYGGLGQGIPSSKNFDYANSLNAKIQSAGGYGLPPGIYSYAFDPSTGMPFMCDPTKTPPGGSKSQAAGAAAINPPTAARKPTADEPSDNVPSEIDSAPSQDIHPSSTNTNKVITAESPPGTNTVGTNTVGTNTVGTNTVGTGGAPEQRLSPIEHTPPSQKAQKDAVSNASPTSLPGKDEITANGNDDDMDEMNDMTSSSPSDEDHDGVTPTPNQHKTTSAVSDKMASSEHLLEKPSTVTPVQQSTGNKVENHVSNDVSNHAQPSGVTSPQKGVQVKLGPPLYVENPKTNPQSSAQTKVGGQKLTPLIDNYHKELKPDGKVKRSNSLKKYFLSKKGKKNEITIKLPEIPPCPDMKNYHWPWNCLGGFILTQILMYF
jgi:hypothetical protein